MNTSYRGNQKEEDLDQESRERKKNFAYLGRFQACKVRGLQVQPAESVLSSVERSTKEEVKNRVGSIESARRLGEE